MMRPQMKNRINTVRLISILWYCHYRHTDRSRRLLFFLSFFKFFPLLFVGAGQAEVTQSTALGEVSDYLFVKTFNFLLKHPNSLFKHLDLLFHTFDGLLRPHILTRFPAGLLYDRTNVNIQYPCALGQTRRAGVEQSWKA